MSVVLVPGQFIGEPHPQGSLANTMLSVALAGSAESGRLRRAKQYFNDGNVLRLEIDAGVLRASVAGSQADPYQVLIHVPVLPRDDTPVAALRSQLNRLTPAAADLDASCNCVDHEALCKHAAAALLAFAFELKFRPELLIHWRTSAVPVQRSAAQVGTGTRRTVKPADVVRRERPAPVWASPEWEHFLGVMPPDAHDILANIPKDAAPLGRATVGTVDLTVFVRDAVAVLRGEQRDA